jgi:hypothetical protein
MKHVTISVSDAMASSKLLGPFFAGPSWSTWRTVIKAAFAETKSQQRSESFWSVQVNCRRGLHKPVRSKISL